MVDTLICYFCVILSCCKLHNLSVIIFFHPCHQNKFRIRKVLVLDKIGLLSVCYLFKICLSFIMSLLLTTYFMHIIIGSFFILKSILNTCAYVYNNEINLRSIGMNALISLLYIAQWVIQKMETVMKKMFHESICRNSFTSKIKITLSNYHERMNYILCYQYIYAFERKALQIFIISENNVHRRIQS